MAERCVLRQLVEVDGAAEDGFGFAVAIGGKVVHALFFGAAEGAGVSKWGTESNFT
jgi:hypothetical protein